MFLPAQRLVCFASLAPPTLPSTLSRYHWPELIHEDGLMVGPFQSYPCFVQVIYPRAVIRKIADTNVPKTCGRYIPNKHVSLQLYRQSLSHESGAPPAFD